MDLIVERTREIRDALHRRAPSASTQSGQLFLEEYYTLAVIGKAGLGTPHMDGNTRLCTATAAAALKETFGVGRPARLLQRLRRRPTHSSCRPQHGRDPDGALDRASSTAVGGPNPPKLIVRRSPRDTATARRPTSISRPRLGTNVPLLNGLMHS